MVKLGKVVYELFLFFIGQHKIPTELPFENGLSFGNVFGAALLFKPGTYFRACFAGFNNIQPVSGRSVILLIGGYDVDYFTVFDLVVYGDDSSVHLGSDHTVAHRRMYGISKINDRRPHRKADNIALWRYNKNVV